MTEMAAAIGLVQLGRLPGMLAARRKAAGLYHQLLTGVDWLAAPGPADSPDQVFQSYVVRVRPDAPLSREALMEHLAVRNIQTQAGVLPVHQQSAHREVRRVPLPVSEDLGKTALFLPMFAELSEAAVERVCAAIKEAQP
jgi:perosamine synthetase